MNSKKITIVAMTALLSATAFAYGDDAKPAATTVSPGSNNSNNVTVGGNVDTGNPGDLSTQPTNGPNANSGSALVTNGGTSSVVDLTTAMGASGSADLSSVTDQSKIKLVKLSALNGASGAATSDELKAAMGAQSGSGDLAAKVDANAAVKAKLEAAGYSSKNVVALSAEADGSVDVFVDDRAK